MKHTMKIGFNEATAMKKSNLETDLLLAEKYKFDYIEIRLDMLHEYLEKHRIKELESFFANSRLKPFAFNAIEEINFLDPHTFARQSDQLKRICEIAQRIGNPYIIAVPSFRNETVFTKNAAEIQEDSVDILNKFADISEKYDIGIALEPVGFAECAVKNMQAARDIIKEVDRDSVGLVIDAFNVYIYDRLKDIAVLDTIDMDKVFVFHINDCEGEIPLDKIELKHRVWPGEGVIPLQQMLKILCNKGYKKIASLELFREEYWNLEPEEVFKIGMEKTKNQLDLYYI